MSSNTWVNYAIGIVGGIAVGFLTAGIGLGAYATMVGLGTFAVTSTWLNAKYAGPKMGGLRPPSGFGNAGGQTGVKDAAAASLQINSASESVLMPVVFGLCRVSANIIRYDNATYRSVPIVERQQIDPSIVAYNLAQKAYRDSPSKVNVAINKQAAKQQQGSGGGKGGSPSQPPPSKTYSANEKIQAYTSVLLEKSNGGKKLPKEYEEFVVGYNYYLSWELAICMGPVDALHAVRVYPGEFSAVDRSASPEIVASETLLTGAGGEQGGTIRFYQGTADQVRNVGDPYRTTYTNYRHTCFAVMQDYWMGNQPAPSSYAFDVERIPVCLDAAGDPVEGMECRGSTDPMDPAWRDANPAAILWEIFTNRIWGKGLDPALLDAPSFVKASQYFADEGIGMSFSLESQTLVTEAVETIRSHVATTVVWYGDKLYCRCQLDRSDAYTPMVVLTSDNFSEPPSISRPAWPNCPNELRATFMNRANNFASEIVMVQDDASIATQGKINSTTIDLPAFSSRLVTERASRRLIGEMSYPQATMQAKMNRFESRLQPGGFFAFVWTEWSAGPVTTFWRVAEIVDNQDASGIQITAVEDLYATPVEGTIDTFTPPVPAFEGMTENDDSDLYYGDDLSGPFDAGNIDLQVVEMPINLTDADRILAFFTQRLNGRTRGLTVHWREAGSGDDWQMLGNLQPWATTGELVASLPAGNKITRVANWEIELKEPSFRGDLLELCNLAPTDSDPLDIVTGSETNVLRVGDELMQIVQAEAGSTAARVRIKAVIRGQFGTDIIDHAAGEPVAFVYEFVPYVMTLRYDQIPINGAVDFMATPYDRFGVTDDPVVSNLTITNRARKAFAVSRAEAVVAGSDWDVTFRPRFHNRGSEDNADLEQMLNTQTGAIPDGYEFFVMPQDGANADLLAEPVKVAPVFTPDSTDGLDPDAGMIQFDYTAPGGTASLLLMQAWDGVLGYPTRITP